MAREERQRGGAHDEGPKDLSIYVRGNNLCFSVRGHTGSALVERRPRALCNHTCINNRKITWNANLAGLCWVSKPSLYGIQAYAHFLLRVY